jgi:predicted DNA-binding antitoxin AbrB/MazE fold protein
MSQSLKAIYENGVFRPLEPVHFDEHQQVILTVDSQTNTDLNPATEQLPTNGAELVEYWKRKGVFGSRPKITDSAEYARQLRRNAETREHE